MLHVLPRARKQILLFIWLNLVVLLTWPNLSAGVTAWPLLIFLFVYGVPALQIRRGQTRWKVNTPSYNFYEGTLPGFYRLHVQIPSGTRATNLPCFVNGQGISNFISTPYFLIRYNHAFPLFMVTHLIYDLLRF